MDRKGMALFWFWVAFFMSLQLVESRIGVGASSPEYWYSNCSNGNFTPGGIFEMNLKSAVSRLPENVSSAPQFFINEAIGSQKEQVYAVASCRGDSDATLCKMCVSDALQKAPVVCPFKRGVIVLYEGCTVGYSDKEFKEFSMNTTSSDGTSFFLKYNNSQAAIQSGVLREGAASLIGDVIDKAAGLSPAHFATGRKTLDTEGHKVYALAECVPTLSSTTCQHCLRLLSSEQIYSEAVGGRISNIWCQLRWELYTFFTGAPLVDLPAAADHQGQTTKHHHKKHHHTWAIVGGAVAGVIIVIAAAIVALLWWRNKKLPRPRQRSSGKIKSDVEETSEASLSSKDEARPSALDRFEEIVELASGKEIVLFLGYDGTLAPIVNDPDKAFMSDEMHGVLQDVAGYYKTSIVSGMARAKVYQFVGLDQINYAGSHGLDIQLSTATATTSTRSTEIVEEERGSYQPAEQHLATITKVYNYLLAATKHIEGASVENNKYCVSVHYRNVATEDQGRVREVVDQVLRNATTTDDDLKLTEGKMVYEVRPPTKWNKGDAVLYLLEHLGLLDLKKVFAIYIGDDKTDEDAFKALLDKECGAGILVSEASKETSATYSLRNPTQVMSFLDMLVQEKRQK